MYQHLRTLTKKETGASAIEYALLVVAIALIMIAGAFALGTAINNKLDNSANCVNDASASNTTC